MREDSMLLETPYLRRLKAKIESGKPVRIMVFCSANADRSPLVEQVLREEFARRGLPNVQVSSFGTTVNPARHLGPAAPRTQEYAIRMGYGGIVGHRRRSLADADVKDEVLAADLLIGVSQDHRRYRATYLAHRTTRKALLSRPWTLRGLAHRTQWTNLDSLLASPEPNPPPQLPYDPVKSTEMYDQIVADAKRCVKRIMG